MDGRATASQPPAVAREVAEVMDGYLPVLVGWGDFGSEGAIGAQAKRLWDCAAG